MRIVLFVVLMVAGGNLFAQNWWRGQIHRPDGESIVFSFLWKKEHGKNVWYIKNADEMIRVSEITSRGDSVFVEMPVFESRFRIHLLKDSISGSWVKRGASEDLELAFTAAPNGSRFDTISSPAKNISGRWSVRYEDDSIANTVAELRQEGSMLTGTFLRATGDYRYLEGIVKNDSMLLSSFDGSHAFLFRAQINNDSMMGVRFSGATSTKSWKAVKDASATISDSAVSMRLHPGQDRLHFSFKDLGGRPVSIADGRFKNKVVVVQVMGSWCPNCMDETAFLSDYYNKNKSRGLEVVAITYEYTTDWERSVKSVRRFQQRFHVQYPMLITGVSVTDSLRTQKTLPELTDIKVFPSTVIIDKKGLVRKIDTGFVGPATGEHYTMYKDDFERTINALLAE